MTLHGIGPLIGQTVRQDRDDRFDSRVVETTDDAFHSTDRIRSSGRVPHNRRANDVSRSGAGGLPCRDQHMGFGVTFKDHDVDPSVAYELADNFLRRSLQHLDQVPFAAAAWARTDTHRNSITVPQRAHLARGEIDIFGPVVWRKETKAVPMRLDHAGYEVQVARQAVLSCAVSQ